MIYKFVFLGSIISISYWWKVQGCTETSFCTLPIVVLLQINRKGSILSSNRKGTNTVNMEEDAHVRVS